MKMKEFNLEVEWNESKEKYDVSFDIDDVSLDEMVQTLSDVLIQSLVQVYDIDYDELLEAAIVVMYLVKYKIEGITNSKLTVEQRQCAQDEAGEWFAILLEEKTNVNF